MIEKKVPIREIAQSAGVSVATVDRVLSDRAKVSQHSTLKVLRALRSLGIGAALPRGARHLLRFDVFMALHDETFFARYKKVFETCADKYGVQVRTVRVTTGIQPIVTALQALGNRCHGVALIARDDESLRQQFCQLVDAGKAAVFMTSGISDARHTYIGIDNAAAGRTAAYLLGRFLGGRGKVLLLTHDLAFQSHSQRIQGFLATCAEQFPALQITGPIECQDSDENSAQAVHHFLQQHSTVDGIYHSGAGNNGVAGALQTLVPKAWIAHEVTPGNVRLLKDGRISALLDQNAELQAEACIQSLLNQLGVTDQPLATRVRLSVVTPQNLEDIAIQGCI